MQILPPFQLRPTSHCSRYVLTNSSTPSESFYPALADMSPVIIDALNVEDLLLFTHWLVRFESITYQRALRFYKLLNQTSYCFRVFVLGNFVPNFSFGSLNKPNEPKNVFGRVLKLLPSFLIVSEVRLIYFNDYIKFHRYFLLRWKNDSE